MFFSLLAASMLVVEVFGKGQLLAVAEEVGSDRCHESYLRHFVTQSTDVMSAMLAVQCSTLLNPSRDPRRWATGCAVMHQVVVWEES